MEAKLRQQFETNGYVVLDGLFSQEEAAKLKKEAKRVLAEKGVDKSGVYVGMAAASPLFKEAAAWPALAATLAEIIGENVVFLSDKIVFKSAATDFGSPWHQDYPYWHGSHKFSAWIALDDATPENGCLRIVPGSHRRDAEHADFSAVARSGSRTVCATKRSTRVRSSIVRSRAAARLFSTTCSSMLRTRTAQARNVGH